MEENNKTVYEIHIVSYPLVVFSAEDYDGYRCTNVTGYKACFRAVIDNGGDEHTNWMNSTTNPLGYTLSPNILVSIFYGKKEGDIVTLKFGSNEYNVRLSQSGKMWGERQFQDVLYELTCAFASRDPADIGDLPEIAQCALMYTNHIEYANSMGMNIKSWRDFKNADIFGEYCKAVSDIAQSDKIAAEQEKKKRKEEAKEKIEQQKKKLKLTN